MLEFSNRVKLLEPGDDLPNLVGAENVYLDFETTSGDPKKDSLNPWHNCDVAGIGITVDDMPDAYYIPVGHQENNLPKPHVYSWLRDVMQNCERWINHNVKYDAHVLKNCTGIDPTCNLVDTVTQAKIIDSDRILRGGYSLKALSKGWLQEGIGKYEEALQPYLHRNKDYGAIPADICGEYGGQDVLTNRRLAKYIDERMPEQCRRVANTEIALTSVLFDMENTGLCIDPQELRAKELEILYTLTKIDEKLCEITGRNFRPHVNGDCFDVLCNQYRLPVLSYTNADKPDAPHNPSFDKKALVQYANHPYAPKKVVELIQEYRRLNTLNGLFVEPYQELHTDGTLHSNYNQCVRTGRMSCSEPNQQQLGAEAKELIHPPPGHSFISCDYSQVEFRVIVHYIKDSECIAAYEKNPDTDFHQWVADMVPIARKPAKGLNFMMAFGGGKKTCVDMLASSKEVIGNLKTEIDSRVASGEIKGDQALQAFEMLCRRKGEKVYRQYHSTLPTLKLTSNRASRALRDKGYVYNLYGRHRRLPESAAHIAFNTLCQSTAADLMKERMVTLADILSTTPIKPVACVHDAIVLTAPTDIADDPRTVQGIVQILEDVQCDLRVPIRCEGGISTESWAAADGASRAIHYTPDPRPLGHVL